MYKRQEIAHLLDFASGKRKQALALHVWMHAEAKPFAHCRRCLLYTSPSRTDVAREMVNLSVNQNAFDANAQVIRASDEMLGTLVDMIV